VLHRDTEKQTRSNIHTSMWLLSLYIIIVQVPLVERELLTLPEHMSLHLSFVALTLVFCLVFCRSLFVLLAIAFSVIRFTSSDYPLWYPQTLRTLTIVHLLIYVCVCVCVCMCAFHKIWYQSINHSSCVIIIIYSVILVERSRIQMMSEIKSNPLYIILIG
jgi:hypothetical protein